MSEKPQTPGHPCAPMGNAPPPTYFQNMGWEVSSVENSPSGPGPGANALGLLAGAGWNAFNLANFSGPAIWNEQRQGASLAYANYVYGVYLNAAGFSLSTALWGANTYGQCCSTYGSKVAMDATYTHIPAANVANITAGYEDERKGTLCTPLIGGGSGGSW